MWTAQPYGLTIHWPSRFTRIHSLPIPSPNLWFPSEVLGRKLFMAKETMSLWLPQPSKANLQSMFKKNNKWTHINHLVLPSEITTHISLLPNIINHFWRSSKQGPEEDYGALNPGESKPEIPAKTEKTPSLAPLAVIAVTQLFSKCGPQTATSASPGNSLEMQILSSTPDLLDQKLWGCSPEVF